MRAAEVLVLGVEREVRETVGAPAPRTCWASVPSMSVAAAGVGATLELWYGNRQAGVVFHRGPAAGSSKPPPECSTAAPATQHLNRPGDVPEGGLALHPTDTKLGGKTPGAEQHAPLLGHDRRCDPDDPFASLKASRVYRVIVALHRRLIPKRFTADCADTAGLHYGAPHAARQRRSDSRGWAPSARRKQGGGTAHGAHKRPRATRHSKSPDRRATDASVPVVVDSVISAVSPVT